jgi:hypothetical protein
MATGCYDLELEGRFNVSERGKEKEPGTVECVKLVEKYIDDMNFSISFGEDDEYVLSMAGYHVENDETKRAFHSHLKIILDRDQLGDLHAFLSFLLGLTGRSR